jgi:hypothetical protein
MGKEAVFAVDDIDSKFPAQRYDTRTIHDKVAHEHEARAFRDHEDLFAKVRLPDYFLTVQMAEMRAINVREPRALIRAGMGKSWRRSSVGNFGTAPLGLERNSSSI